MTQIAEGPDRSPRVTTSSFPELLWRLRRQKKTLRLIAITPSDAGYGGLSNAPPTNLIQSSVGGDGKLIA